MSETEVTIAKLENGVEICYETFGDPTNPTVLLVMGLGMQMIAWHDAFCRIVAEAGYHVVRYDNRDVGFSTHFDELAVEEKEFKKKLAWAFVGGRIRPPYSLDELAGDAIYLLDAIGVRSAHVVGVSMGGMIAQLFAINHPTRVKSLTSIMSTTGDSDVGRPTLRAMKILARNRPATRDEAIRGSIEAFRVLSAGHFDEATTRLASEREIDRMNYPEGTSRQLLAVVAAPSRTVRLRRVGVPTIVIHGEADPLINVSGAVRTAAAIPRSKLIVIEGMGHFLAPSDWPEVIGAILGNLALGEAAFVPDRVAAW